VVNFEQTHLLAGHYKVDKLPHLDSDRLRLRRMFRLDASTRVDAQLGLQQVLKQCTGYGRDALLKVDRADVSTKR